MDRQTSDEFLTKTGGGYMPSRNELFINGVPAARFIKEAYGLGDDLSGEGHYDLDDPAQTALRHIKNWVAMAEHDALHSRQ